MCDCAPLVAALRRDRIETDRSRRLVAKLLDSNVCVEHHEGLSNRADFGSRIYAPQPSTEVWVPTRTRINAARALEDSTTPVEWTARLDPALWRTAYAEDATAREIIETLKGDESRTTLWSENYELDSDGLLYLRPRHDGEQRRLYVPRDKHLLQETMSICHDSVTAGHGGVTKTLRRALDQFYWPHMRQTVKRYVAGCETCARGKPFTAPPGPLHPVEIPAAPYSAISLDLVTALPKARAYFDGQITEVDSVLTVVDLLTHFVHFFAVPKSVTGEQIARILVNDIFVPQATVPTKIVSDRDPRWTSKLVREIMDLIGTRLALSTAQSPMTNGVCEAKNKHLVTYLKTLGARSSDWPKMLHTCALSYNSAYSVSIGMSPVEARFGTAPAFPFGFATQPTRATNLPAVLRDLKEAQELAVACAKDALQAAGDSATAAARGETASATHTGRR